MSRQHKNKGVGRTNRTNDKLFSKPVYIIHTSSMSNSLGFPGVTRLHSHFSSSKSIILIFSFSVFEFPFVLAQYLLNTKGISKTLKENSKIIGFELEKWECDRVNPGKPRELIIVDL